MVQKKDNRCRIHKFLAACGVASRRQAEALIGAGRVKKNGAVVEQPGTLCDPDMDVIEVDGRRVRTPDQRVYLMVNKPPGYVCTVRDPHARQRILDLVAPDLAVRVKPVGRLDKDSEGLVLLMDDGALINRLTHPRYHVEKEYEVAVRGDIDGSWADRFLRGVELEDGPARALQAEIVRRDRSGGVLRIVLGEGRKRQIRRMVRAGGAQVDVLRRVRIGPLRLGPLPQGSWRHLTTDEVRLLYRATGARRNRDQETPTMEAGASRHAAGGTQPRRPRSTRRARDKR